MIADLLSAVTISLFLLAVIEADARRARAACARNNQHPRKGS